MAKTNKKSENEGTIEVVALKSFSGIVDGQSYSTNKGKTIKMPIGADWIECGFAKPIKEEKKEPDTSTPTKIKVTEKNKIEVSDLPDPETA